MQVTTADVIPPGFTAGTPSVIRIHETDFTLSVQLNKSSCTVFYSVMLYGTAQPTLASVLTGTAPGSLFSGTIIVPDVSLSLCLVNAYAAKGVLTASRQHPL